MDKIKKTYSIDNTMGQDIIWYEEDGIRYSFMADPANSDYQAYLADEAKTK